METVRIAVGLEGTGWHPGAWREPGARPGGVLDAGYWVGLARRAEEGLVDLVTIGDALGVELDGAGRMRADRVQGRLDATLVAARVALATSAVGLVPAVSATHTEPFHVSKAIATLDWVSGGRAGVLVTTSPDPAEDRHVGRRADLADLEAEAEDHIEVQRRLWDSWEDGAEIRDVATGRFVDRERLHRVDFEGRWFCVRGPSITPRPPQGQPVVVTTFPSPGADLVLGTDLVDLPVVLGRTDAAAAARLARLDDLAGERSPVPGEVFVGTPAGLAERLATLGGAHLRPAALPADLDLVVGEALPALQAMGRFRRSYAEPTLRERLGLPRPANRYARA